MTDRKYYLWLIPAVLVFGLVLGLVFTFQPVMAGSVQGGLESYAYSEAGQQSIAFPEEVAVPQVEIDPACTLDTVTPAAIAHWPLNETSGTTFADAVAGLHPGSCSGDSCPSPISGTNAGGQFFISTDPDAITVPSDTAFNFLAADSFSAGIWVKTTQYCTDNEVFIGRYENLAAEGRWWLGCVPGSTPGEGVARFHMRDSNDFARSATGSTRINDGKWHYLTGVWDGTDSKLYVDGGLETTVSSPLFSGNFNSTEPLTIGHFDNSYYPTGALDEAAVFDSALLKTFIDTYIGTCTFTLDVGDVTFNTGTNLPIDITAAELLANSGAVTLSAVDGTSEMGGAISGTAPAGPFTYTPPLGYLGTDFFTFEVTDSVDTARGSAVITMEFPLVTNPGPQTNYEGAAVSLPIVAVDPNGDVMTYAATGLPGGLSITVDTGLISGKVLAGTAGIFDPVTVTVTDDKDYATAVEFVWTINANAIPVITPIGNQTTEQGELVSLQVNASDGDTDVLTYGALNLPPGLSIDTSSGLIDGTVSMSAVVGVPYHVTVTVTDGKAAPVTALFDWTITGNRPPVVVKPADQVNVEGATVSLQVQANDPDGDSLTYSATGLPPGLSITSTSGLISGKITAGAGTFSPFTVKVRATDPKLLFDEEQFTWTIGANVFLPLVMK